MTRVVILGAGIAGHTAALHASKILGKKAEVVVISPKFQLELDPLKYLGGRWQDEKRSGDLSISAHLQAKRN